MLCLEVLLNILLVIKSCHSLTIYQPSKEVAAPHKTISRTTQLGANIYPAQYQLNKRWSAKSPTTNEQPATADWLHNGKANTRKEPSIITYHNEIYHLKGIKTANPFAQQRFNVRKQRNLRENHDKKISEQNIEEVENVNEDSERQSTAEESSNQPSTTTSRATRYSHDIFLNYPKSHHVNFGHIELSPVLFEKRFASQKAGNRYKGEIMWLDNTGGFAQHYWDLAQGRL